jgi:3-phosphoshikimate 1-carboxyvinyltransferase
MEQQQPHRHVRGNPLSFGSICGHITLPASKSLSNRALIIAALCGGCTLYKLSDADDTRLLQTALCSSSYEARYVGAGGTTARFLTAYFAASEGTHLLYGTPRLHQRPIADLVNALRDLGASITYEGLEGCLPLRIVGKILRGGTVSLNANISSQFVSALLLVAPTFAEGLELTMKQNPVSKPYIDMTLGIMRHFGVVHTWKDDKTISIAPQPYIARSYTVEADWSAASYYYAAAALAQQADITLYGLQAESLQGDQRIADIARTTWGITTHYQANGIRLLRPANAPPHTSQANEWCFDFTPCPDIAQTVAVVNAALGIPSRLMGLQTLRHKETDRIAALDNELQKIGYRLLPDADSSKTSCRLLPIPHYTPLSTHDAPPRFATYDDHRMAMAVAPLSLRYPQGIIVENADVVGKSYPYFWRDWERLCKGE